MKMKRLVSIFLLSQIREARSKLSDLMDTHSELRDNNEFCDRVSDLIEVLDYELERESTGGTDE